MEAKGNPTHGLVIAMHSGGGFSLINQDKQAGGGDMDGRQDMEGEYFVLTHWLLEDVVVTLKV